MAKIERPGEIRALAGARALPPLFIVLFHFGEGHHYYHVPWLDLITARGYLWVEFFFALSGFILTHVYGARLAQLFSRDGYLAFLRARLTKLYPLHLFMLVALLFLFILARTLAHLGGYASIYDLPGHPDMSVKGFLLSLVLVHAWNTMNTLTWNGASWFVSVEFALCLLFPAFAWLAYEGKLWRGLLLVAAGLGGLVALDFSTRYGLDITFHNGVLRGVADFSVGVGMAVLYRLLKPRDRLPDAAHSAIQLGLFFALVFALLHSGWSHNHNDIWCVIPMLALVLALAFDRGLLADALKTRIAVVVGGWSYAIYMGQTFWLQSIHIFEHRLYPPTSFIGMHYARLIFWLEPTLLVLVCVGWGALLAKCIEHPATALLKPRQ